MALQGTGPRLTPAERLLLEAGADDLAHAFLERRLAAHAEHFELARAEFERIPRATRAVLALVVDQAGGTAYPCCVELAASGPWPGWLMDDARRAVENAFDEAWRAVGGVGLRENLSLQLPLIDALDVRVEVRGPSLWLPAFLAASARFSGASPARTVIATGAFDKPIDCLDEKARRAARCIGNLGGPRSARLLVATSSPAEAVDLVPSPRQALARAFAVTPRAPSAEFVPVQVSFDVPAERLERWRERRIATVHFGRVASAATLRADTEQVMDTLRELPAGGPIELAVRGPQAFAASLGCRLRNHPLLERGVRFLHTNRGEGVVWDGGSFDALAAPEPSTLARSSRLHLVRREQAPLEGDHQRVMLDDEARHPEAVFAAMQRLRDAATAPSVELFLSGTVAAAFAAGMVLRQRACVFYQFDTGQQRYEPWFSQDR